MTYAIKQEKLTELKIDKRLSNETRGMKEEKKSLELNFKWINDYNVLFFAFRSTSYNKR